jgi:hypothetical protein
MFINAACVNASKLTPVLEQPRIADHFSSILVVVEIALAYQGIDEWQDCDVLLVAKLKVVDFIKMLELGRLVEDDVH